MAAAARGATAGGARLQAQGDLDTQALRAREMADAAGQYFGAATGQRGADLGLATSQASLNQGQRSANDQRELSWLVLGCRGGLDKMAPALSDRTFRAQLASLRLAVLFHHARLPIDAPRLSLRVGTTIRFDVSKRWLAAHPLTAHLLAKEAREWTALGYRFS